MTPVEYDLLPSTICVEIVQDLEALRKSTADLTSSIQRLNKDHSALEASVSTIVEHKSICLLPNPTVKGLTSTKQKELSRNFRMAIRLNRDFTEQFNKADSFFEKYSEDRRFLDASPLNSEDLDKTSEIAAGFRCLRANVQTATEAVQIALMGQRRLFKLVDSILAAINVVEKSNLDRKADIAINALKTCFQELKMDTRHLLGSIKGCLDWVGKVKGSVSDGLKMVVKESKRLDKEKEQVVANVPIQLESIVPNVTKRNELDRRESCLSSPTEVLDSMKAANKAESSALGEKESRQSTLPSFSQIAFTPLEDTSSLAPGSTSGFFPSLNIKIEQIISDVASIKREYHDLLNSSEEILRLQMTFDKSLKDLNHLLSTVNIARNHPTPPAHVNYKAFKPYRRDLRPSSTVEAKLKGMLSNVAEAFGQSRLHKKDPKLVSRILIGSSPIPDSSFVEIYSTIFTLKVSHDHAARYATGITRSLVELGKVLSMIAALASTPTGKSHKLEHRRQVHQTIEKAVYYLGTFQRHANGFSASSQAIKLWVERSERCMEGVIKECFKVKRKLLLL
ncbi:hypothetical protein HDU67_006523 [Dinochytrium kinnereticum]|nr:hypothetical protein HDU67_006523 [Dinochytrium kinnereticum]